MVLWEDASGQPGEKQTTNDSSIAPQHGRYQQDGSSTQGWKKQRPVIENWIKQRNTPPSIPWPSVLIWSLNKQLEKYLQFDSLGLWSLGSFTYWFSNLVSCWCLQRKSLQRNKSISVRVPREKKGSTNMLTTHEKQEVWSRRLLCYSEGFLTDLLREKIHRNVLPCPLRCSGVRPRWFLSWSILHPVLCSRAQQTSTLPVSAATWSAVAPWWSTASTAHLWQDSDAEFISALFDRIG